LRNGVAQQQSTLKLSFKVYKFEGQMALCKAKMFRRAVIGRDGEQTLAEQCEALEARVQQLEEQKEALYGKFFAQRDEHLRNFQELVRAENEVATLEWQNEQLSNHLDQKVVRELYRRKSF